MSKEQRPAETTARVPRPDSYYTESGLSWTFQPVLTTPAAAIARPGVEVWGWPTKMHDGSGRKVVLVCFDAGCLGFVPEAVAGQMWKAVEGAARTFGKDWRAVAGVAKLRGAVTSREGAEISINLSLLLHQRQGEPEAKVTPLMFEAWGIDRNMVSDSQS